MSKAYRKVKLTGDRSIESKLQRLAYELEADAARIRGDHPDQDGLANGIQAVSSKLGSMARSIKDKTS